MVLAYLDGDAVKNPWNASSAVENDRLNGIPQSFEFPSKQLILKLRLVSQLGDVQILVRVRVACDQDAVLSAEVCRVDDQNDRARSVYFLRQLRCVEKLGDGARGLSDINP